MRDPNRPPPYVVRAFRELRRAFTASLKTQETWIHQADYGLPAVRLTVTQRHAALISATKELTASVLNGVYLTLLPLLPEGPLEERIALVSEMIAEANAHAATAVHIMAARASGENPS
jgi:hypothetical protein